MKEQKIMGEVVISMKEMEDWLGDLPESDEINQACKGNRDPGQTRERDCVYSSQSPKCFALLLATQFAPDKPCKLWGRCVIDEETQDYKDASPPRKWCEAMNDLRFNCSKRDY